ncbi:general substrate transporter [Aspergillus carlsbadensis]|nr:general substrate transporter [Aspergillus carlsbadensis]
MPTFVHDFGTGNTALGAPFLTSTDVSLITAVPAAGSLLGVPLAAFGADRFGRKRMLLVSCAISLVASAMQTASNGIALMVAGRAVNHISILMFLTLATAWVPEIAPQEIRGTLASLSIFVINLAAVITACINYGTEGLTTSAAYRVPLGLQLVWPLILGSCLFFLDDAPTFYLIKGQDERAEQSLRRIRRGYSDMEVESELRALRSQKALRQEDTDVPLAELFKGVNLRRTLLALSVPNLQQLSGIAFATNYATIFLKQAVPGLDAFVLSIALNVLSLGGSIAGMLLVDRVGRRPLALTSFTILLIINTIVGGLGFADASVDPSVAKAIAAFCLMFGFFYAAGFGGLTYVIAAEMPTARLKNRTTGLTFLVVSVFQIAVAYGLPYIVQPDGANLQAKTYLIFAGWMVFSLCIVFFFVPETKGRSAAEIDEMFEAGVPARKFSTYVCRNTRENMQEEVRAAEKGVVSDHAETV